MREQLQALANLCTVLTFAVTVYTLTHPAAPALMYA